MVTKVKMDRAIGDAISRFDQRQAETDQRLEAAAQQATQDRAMLAQMFEQLQLQREQQDLSFTPQLTAPRQELPNQSKNHNPTLGEGERSQFILHTDKCQMEMGSGSKHQSDTEYSNRTDRYQPPRADCPSFTGENVIEWICRYNSYFEMHQVPPSYKSKLTILQFTRITSEWYDCYLIDHESPDWSQLVQLVRRRFQSRVSKNGMEELMDTHQTGSVIEYIEKFERLRARLLLENHLFF
jgi:Retrotransposon gag protein